MVERMFDGGWRAGLTSSQRAAADHEHAPLLIVAGAGTGKTRTLTARVAALVERGVRPERILLLTFTRRAAEEMLSRAAAMCSLTESRGGSRGRLDGGTFHAVAHGLVVAHAPNLGLGDGVSVIDPGDARDLMDMLRRDHQLADAADQGTRPTQRVPRGGTLLDIYSRAVNTGQPARTVVDEQFPWVQPDVAKMLELFRAYTRRKRASGLLDFDDLLLHLRALLSDPVIGAAIRDRWDHVLIDEYQDVNGIQADIAALLRPDGTGLTVVGDDAQAIYGFRGADSRHLDEFAGRYPDAVTVVLEDNFRARQPLLDLANAVRPSSGGLPVRLRSVRAGGRRARLVECYDSATEATAVVDTVLADVEDGRSLRDQAVLMRAAHHSDLLEVELTSRRVPFVKYGGLKFLEAAHVKDFLAALRVLDNPRDELAWFRLFRLHDRVGPARARELLDVWRPAEPGADGRRAEVVAHAPARTRAGIASTMDALVDARKGDSLPARVHAVVELLRPLLTSRYDDHQARLNDLARLADSAGAARSLHDYAVGLTLDPPEATGDLAGPPHRDDDYLVLSTVHSAKGLEWECVHLINVVDGAFPSDMALGRQAEVVEEERLFYVATTRARDELSIYVPLRQPHHRRARDDRHSYAQASRFITAEARAVLDTIPMNPRRTIALPADVADVRVAVPSLDDLWS